jgi:hypothetical protein
MSVPKLGHYRRLILCCSASAEDGSIPLWQVHVEASARNLGHRGVPKRGRRCRFASRREVWAGIQWARTRSPRWPVRHDVVGPHNA